ncbi:Uu.00g030130.m01.CDS01 [Anthostomella pinea]|uniref:Uu.00g030130.m01.CDS01 n=1 Tax=Anthostomella pinea TaxID=933095 RepID=A0AAI8YCX5_9PEZI|nr:Uu.00g030130.m01.CDS01 [Anthostomella pinea]
MALIGLSLVLASVVYIAIRRPPFLQTLIAFWRGDPRIEQPPTTRSLPSGSRSHTGTDHGSASTDNTSRDAPSEPTTATAKGAEAARMAMPPPPPVIRRPNGSAAAKPASPSPETTPKAVPSTAQSSSSIPSFSLSSSPPASAAALARTSDSTTTPTTLPTISAAPSSPAKPFTTSMAPPPRPPTLNGTINSTSSLLAPPNRGGQQHARQPGTSTLAPPPTHSSKPSKPSRKVTLEPGHSPLDWARLANHPASDLRGLGPGAPYVRVTPSMLRRQTGRKGKDAWTALGGRVYNMTPYLPFHPGGEPELLRAAGRDGTRLFGEIHPWVNYETMLSSCLIGLLVDEGEAEGGGEMDAMD